MKRICMTTIILWLGSVCLSQENNSSTNNMKPNTSTMTITHIFDAPLEKVWHAWSDSGSVKEWWGPEGFTAPVARIDFREGGVSLVCMRSADGFEIYTTWTYTKIQPLQRIEFINHFVDKDGNKLDPAKMGLPAGIPYEVPHTLVFKDLGGGKTELSITEYGYAAPEAAAMSKAGMAQVLNKLANVLKKDQ